MTMTLGTFTTKPFSCPSCIKKIESAVGRMDGVESVDVGFNSSRVKVVFDDSRTSAEAIGKVIDGLGYPVVKTRTTTH